MDCGKVPKNQGVTQGSEMPGRSGERRKSSRKSVLLCADAIEPIAMMLTPQKVNINELGMYLRTNTECKPGQEIFVVVGDPSMKRLIAVKAKVVRVTKLRGEWKFGIGVRFHDVPLREAGIIREIERTARFTLPRVILMSDDAALLDLISKKLPEDRYDIAIARSIEELKKSYKEEKPTLVIANISGTDKEISSLREATGDAAVVVITGDTGSELKSMSGLHGIYEFVDRPIEHAKFMKAVGQSIQAYRMATERKEGNLAEITIKKDGVTNKKKVRRLVARSGNMVFVYRQVERVAGLDPDPVLIIAESGAGKEVVANRIHLLSKRKNKPLVVADLSAIPANLVESTLFGHLKGSFTGADKNQPGVVGEAKGGTLFLDEISVLHLDLQPKLLRLMAEGEYKRIGETRMRPANARIIIATNEDLAAKVRQGEFREDLYNRLNVHQIMIPPFRERSEEDRHELALEIIAELNHHYKTNVVRLGSEAYDQLMTHSWPGNVRDLENAVKRSLPGTKGNTLMKFNLGSSTATDDQSTSPGSLLDFEKPWKPNHRLVVDHFECIYCGKIYDRFNRNVKLASQHAEMTPQQFNRKLCKHKLRNL